MNRIVRRAGVLGGSLGVAGGLALSTLPAGAATSSSAAWGAAATGPAVINPVALATPQHTPAVAAHAKYTNFLATGLIVDRASPATSHSLVKSQRVNLAAFGAPAGSTVSASKITSWCRASGDNAFRGASIAGGWMDGTHLPVHPELNTVLVIRNRAGNPVGSVTLKWQGDMGGHLMAIAIYVSLGPEILELGAAQCGPTVE
ncbi:MAG: hypothetical protein ACLPKI_00050 [Streptosporangiaceae bacterium]